MYSQHENKMEMYDVLSVENGSIRCRERGCDFRSHRVKQLRQHLNSTHNMNIPEKTCYFPNIEGFEVWKENYEFENNFCFYLLSTKNERSCNYYYCSLGKKKVDENGRKKLTNHCTASLVSRVNRNSGQVTVELIDVHYGHDPPLKLPDGSPTHFGRRERGRLLQKINDGLEREQLFTEYPNTTREEQILLRRHYDRFKFYKIYKEAENAYTEGESREHWRTLFVSDEVKGFVLHKVKGQTDRVSYQGTIKLMKADDFMIAVMSKLQQHLLMKFAKTLIIETTASPSGIQNGRLLVLYLMVLDDLGHDVPVGFCVYNHNNTHAVKCFFSHIQKHCGNISVELIIVNDFENLYNQWVETFPDNMPARLISPWFIESTYNAQLQDCNLGSQTFDNMLDAFNNMLKFQDVSEFRAALKDVIQDLNKNPKASVILNYVSDTLLQRCQAWALCYFSRYREEINHAMLSLTPHTIKRLHAFVNRKSGRCIYLILQNQRTRIRKYHFTKKAPGRKANPISSAPTLLKQPVPEPPIKQYIKMELQTNTDGVAQEILIHELERLLNMIPTVDETGLKEIMKELSETAHYFPSQDKNGKVVRPRILKTLCKNLVATTTASNVKHSPPEKPNGMAKLAMASQNNNNATALNRVQSFPSPPMKKMESTVESLIYHHDRPADKNVMKTTTSPRNQKRIMKNSFDATHVIRSPQNIIKPTTNYKGISKLSIQSTRLTRSPKGMTKQSPSANIKVSPNNISLSPRRGFKRQLSDSPEFKPPLKITIDSINKFTREPQTAHEIRATQNISNNVIANTVEVCTTDVVIDEDKSQRLTDFVDIAMQTPHNDCKAEAITKKDCDAEATTVASVDAMDVKLFQDPSITFQVIELDGRQELVQCGDQSAVSDPATDAQDAIPHMIEINVG